MGILPGGRFEAVNATALGLELVPERTLVPTLVIDRISRPAPD